MLIPFVLFGQNDFFVSSCHPYHINNGYYGNFFGVSTDLLFNVGETVITVSYAGENHTFTVIGSGGYSSDNCYVTYIYLDGNLNEIFNGPLTNGADIQIHGCTNQNASNYNIQASIDDNSCIIEGCTNTTALNYNPLASQEDGSCVLNIEDISNQLNDLYQQINDTKLQLDNYFTCQEISHIIPIDIDIGWNMIGYTCYDNQNISSVFNDIQDKIIIAKDSDGNAYLPEWDFNAIGNLTYANGYQIKVNENISNFQFCPILLYEDNQSDDNSFDILGCTNPQALNYNQYADIDDNSCTEEINEALIIIDNCKVLLDSIQTLLYTQPNCNITLEDSYINLSNGWNIFGYTCAEPIDPVVGLNEIQDQIIILKDEEGNAYLPEWNFSAIDQLEFAEGYQIKIENDVSDFQFCPKSYCEEIPGCQEHYLFEEECYQQYFTSLDVDSSDVSKFVINAARWREICEVNIGHLKNPLFSINKNGKWVIYYHIENWIGPVMAEAITNLTETYQYLANQWLDLIDDYDPSVPSQVKIHVFGFVFNQGVELDDSFYEIYGDYPIVTNWQGTNEESPWEIRFKNNNNLFSQNWYQDVDYTEMYVSGNRNNVGEDVIFFPTEWEGYIHPEEVDMFFTKFWHKTTWDAVAQRQYLKVGGQIQNYADGTINTSVFSHEMGHCFFHDDIYDSGKYPNNQNIISIMNTHPLIADFDAMIQRMVWEKQRELN